MHDYTQRILSAQSQTATQVVLKPTHDVTQASLELVIFLLSQLPKCWDHRNLQSWLIIFFYNFLSFCDRMLFVQLAVATQAFSEYSSLYTTLNIGVSAHL